MKGPGLEPPVAKGPIDLVMEETLDCSVKVHDPSLKRSPGAVQENMNHYM